MGLVSKNNGITHNIGYQRKMQITFLLGVSFFTIAAVMELIDPILILAKYKLRITKGSILHKLLMSEIQGNRLEMYVFNITNAQEFLAGTDYKLKIQEIGPFVYQEYRTNENIEFDTEAEVIRFMPRARVEFILEESIGDPKDFVLNVPNIPLLTTVSLLSPYPYLVRQLLNMMISQIGSKPIMKIDVHSYLWWYDDPIIRIMTNLVPGLIYYDGTGILERLYDEKADYTLEMGTNEDDKFKVKSVRRSRHEKIWTNDSLVDSVTSFNNTYEGAAFPPGLTTETPIRFYRHGICKTFGMEYSGEALTEIGVKAFVYKYDNQTFANDHLCHSDGYCPYGLLDLSSCFFGLPFGVSKAHFLDSDPKLLERIEGLNPDEEKHSSQVLIEPRIGLTVGASMALQLNIVFGDVNYNYQARRFTDFVLPVAYITLTLPELPAETKNSMTLLYVTGPRILLASEITCCLIGLIFISYSIRLVYCKRQFTKKDAKILYNSPLREKHSVEIPLVRNEPYSS